jgi:probable F420-dependent oxidoreductase
MQLAISPTTPGLDAAELVDLAVAAEGLGYTSAWLAEVAGAEAFSLAAAIAARTESLDVGVAVVPAATRSPSLMAMGSATVSGVLEGRAFGLGIGASSEAIVRRWHDREFAPPLQRVREAVEATRTLLSGEHSYSGETVSVDRFRLGMSPRGPIGIYVGALGPRMLRLAGAIGDGVCLNLMTVEAVALQRAELARGAADAGRSLDAGFEVMARFHTVVTDDLDHGRGVIRAGFGPYFAQPVYNRFLAWMGFTEEAEAIAAAFAGGDRAGVAEAFHDDLVDRVALVGPPERIRSRLDAYADAGIDIAAIGLIGLDAAGAAEALAAIAAA